MSHKTTILIVDDEIVSRSKIEEILDLKEDYTLVFAADGIQALEKVEIVTPDLVFLDAMMPGINGFEVCRRLRNNPRLANLPVVMVTARDDPTARLRCLELGATDVICKPFDHYELNVMVYKFTQSSQE